MNARDDRVPHRVPWLERTTVSRDRVRLRPAVSRAGFGELTPTVSRGGNPMKGFPTDGGYA